jgi:formate hydrogenlyase subunit 6/NADH:ubiquinone oxidoreductase subunit I
MAIAVPKVTYVPVYTIYSIVTYSTVLNICRCIWCHYECEICGEANMNILALEENQDRTQAQQLLDEETELMKIDNVSEETPNTPTNI